MSTSGRPYLALAFGVAWLAAGAWASGSIQAPRLRCQPATTTALPDLAGPYRGLAPGLYPDGRTSPPPAHAAARAAAARRIVPLDAGGRPDVNGQIVVLSIGMSNTSAEFEGFTQDARRSPAVNPRVAIVNGALSGADAAMWATEDSPAWRHVTTALRGRGSPAQVQAIWMKQVHLRTEPFPGEVERLADDLEATIRIARARFPNLRLVYASSRTRSGVTTRRGPAEPQAYETAFAVRRLIERQGTSAGAPVITWGPYLWANSTPRSDGLTWECQDLQQDLLHPSDTGVAKVARQLMAFFASDPAAAPWFLDPRHRHQEAATAVASPAARGRAPMTVTFSDDASWATARVWTFGDGTSSVEARPAKTFHRPGVYEAWLTAMDGTGRWTRASVRVEVE